MNINIEITLNRNKIIDEAILLAICGRNQIKENSRITGLVRLEISKNMLEQCINKLKEK